MIRSIPVNTFGIVLGIVILLVGFAYLTEDVLRAGISGLLSPHALLIGGFNITLGLWALIGSVRNLKNRRQVPKRPMTLQEKCAAVVLVMFLGAGLVLVVLLSVPSTPSIEWIGRVNGIVLISSVPLGLLVAIWSAISQRLAAKKPASPKV